MVIVLATSVEMFQVPVRRPRPGPGMGMVWIACRFLLSAHTGFALCARLSKAALVRPPAADSRCIILQSR